MVETQNFASLRRERRTTGTETVTMATDDNAMTGTTNDDKLTNQPIKPMSDKYRDKYRIASARAPFYDYSEGEYFVTICTKSGEHYFGEITNDDNAAGTSASQMRLSEIGKYAEQCWCEIPRHFPHVETPLWVIMPNHIHGIVIIRSVSAMPNVQIRNVETQNFASLRQREQMTTGKQFGPQSKNLASVIRGFKIGVSKFANQNDIPFVWQPRFHDHIIRNKEERNRIAEYIENNVVRWEADCYYDSHP